MAGVSRITSATSWKTWRFLTAISATTESGRTPDFIFPSCEDYHDPGYPSDLLRMVGCKTVVGKGTHSGCKRPIESR